MRRLRPTALAVLVGAGLLGSCHSSPSAPSPAPVPQPTLNVDLSVSASLTRWAAQPWEIEYSFCYWMIAESTEIATMKFRRFEFTILDQFGEVYRTWSDSHIVGETIGMGRGSCFDGVDLDITRPVAPFYRVFLEYGADGAAPRGATFTGLVTSKVPPLPFITGATLVEDITDPQNILRQPGPITFTVTHVEGGTPPFLYQFKVNGFLMQDWSTDPVFVWDGLTLNGSPVVSGGYNTSVAIRRSTWNETEWGASVNFIFLLQRF